MEPFALHPQLEKDTFFAADLSLSRLLLMNDARFPWFILVPRGQKLTEIMDLPLEKQGQLLYEINALSAFLKSELKAEKLNIAALGNVVPQLHIHVIGRFMVDAAWPKPVWGFGAAQAYGKMDADKTIKLAFAHMGKIV